MSQLELLKTRIDSMDNQIREIGLDIKVKQELIEKISNTKREIDQTLIDEQAQCEKLIQNYTYLSEVKKDTSINYHQIEEAAITLLEIIQNKCSSIT